MEPICYHHKELGYSPVKKYLAQYDPCPTDSPKESNRKAKIAADIKSKIIHLVNSNGISRNLAKSLAGRNLIQLGIRKTGNILIRILYIQHKDFMVLLHIFEKPDKYKGDKIKKEIEREYDLAESYGKNFISNPKLYEKF